MIQAQRPSRQPPQLSMVQPRRSDRDTKSHKKTKLRIKTQDLMEQFAVLESTQVHEGTAGCEADRVLVISLVRSV